MTRFSVVNPATGHVVREIQGDSPAQVMAKVGHARAQQKAWASTSLAHRIEVVRQCTGLITQLYSEFLHAA